MKAHTIIPVFGEQRTEDNKTHSRMLNGNSTTFGCHCEGVDSGIVSGNTKGSIRGGHHPVAGII